MHGSPNAEHELAAAVLVEGQASGGPAVETPVTLGLQTTSATHPDPPASPWPSLYPVSCLTSPHLGTVVTGD